ncbi:hypothetical protein L249_3521 [Ophiocordyceps polyrhachis-furcata BCC 54312]|uniref:Uncharacterized protein n=1 Tax=Ophiocordyceps polyrhachis-furcata BCC 54312 TaxID=1330021 RepID=A0A367LMP4_9HYPO|nr:hypothetical protein L249_3521 [Ophiocordyceps polyrhachis-furcata BCC 54312]
MTTSLLIGTIMRHARRGWAASYHLFTACLTFLLDYTRTDTIMAKRVARGLKGGGAGVRGTELRVVCVSVTVSGRLSTLAVFRPLLRIKTSLKP